MQGTHIQKKITDKCNAAADFLAKNRDLTTVAKGGCLMKLIRAEFENFRLLRDLKLSFSTDGKRNLTVIRAENETGKTTILNGLQWASLW